MNASRRIRRLAGALTSFATIVAVVAASVLAGPVEPADAADVSGWDPGYIISDAAFYNGNAMATVDVQWFMANANPACSSGYTCIKDFRSTTRSIPADAMCSAYNGGGVESAAEIITKVGQACGISQRVLLVLLQKEQSLITSPAPTASRYDRAMGYACPDTAPCDQEYYGFFNQVYNSARQFKRYGNPPGTSNFFNWYPVGRTSNVRFSPNTACGSFPVEIRNKATAALYYYTPYQPNQAALANLYGTGDGCSAYGNRNFWRLYTDWFGSPNGSEDSFVRLVYRDIFGRDVDDSGRSFWVRQLKSGQSRTDVANALLSSTEYRTNAITAVYRDFLDRDPDAAGMAFWMRGLADGAIRTDQLRLAFLGSEEFFNNVDQSQPAFITEMYKSLLGREPSASDIEFYLGNSSTAGRNTTIDSIYRSPESVGIRVEALYQRYLGKGANGDDQAFWLSPVQRGGDPAMLRGIFISAEYDRRALAAYPGP